MSRLNHRVLYNGDWGALFWAPNIWQPEGGPYSTKALHRFAQLLSESGVDTFAISPNTQIAWYPSKVVPTALDGYTRSDPRWAHWFRAHPPETNLEGTGFEWSDAWSDFIGGSTGWYRTTWPVEPNEIFFLTFSVHDESDGIYDSLVIIDNFRWLFSSPEGTTHQL